MSTSDRREFLKQTALYGVAAAALRCSERLAGRSLPDEGPLPVIRLGEVEVSRLILGSNPFFALVKIG